MLTAAAVLLGLFLIPWEPLYDRTGADRQQEAIAAVTVQAYSGADASYSSRLTLESGTEAGERYYSVADSQYMIYFNDEEDLIDDSQESDLILTMAPITQYGNAAFMTTRIGSSYYEEATKDIYHGLFGNESGTIFLIDMNNRQLIIFSDGTVYKTVTKSYASTITDNVYKMAKHGDYYGCAKEAFSEISTILSGSKIAQPMRHITNAMLAVFLSTLLLYFISRTISSQRAAGSSEILSAIGAEHRFSSGRALYSRRNRVYNPHTDSSSSGGGGGGGGGSSGGGGSHGF